MRTIGNISESNTSRVYHGQFGYSQVTTEAKAGHQKLSMDITIPTGGFLYTYVINESNVSATTSVYFDDFIVLHTRTVPTLQVAQTTDYYPFGLAMAAQSYQKQSALDNDYLYNGKELQDEHNLGWMDYGARMYMSDIGRWGVIDPLTNLSRRWSPYTYCYNNPLVFIDPDGMFGEYYTKNGKHLGSDGIDDKKVYTADKATTASTKAEDGTQTTTTTFENAEEIGVESDFVDMNDKTISSDETKKELVGLAIYLRNEEGIEGAKINVTDGDRGAKQNKKTGGTPGSPHKAGHAADITVNGMSNDALAYAAANSGIFTGVIWYPIIGDTQGFGTHTETVTTGEGICETTTSNINVQNYQNLRPHVHVDNRAGTGVQRYRYAGDTSWKKDDQTAKYVPWTSNNQIR